MSTEKIRELNDTLRKAHGFNGFRETNGCHLYTLYVSNMDVDKRHEVMKAMQEFDTFSEDNDPHGEHDFGIIKMWGESFYWKIDYYDTDVKYHSPDPSDITVTRRVLTLMHSSEY